VIFGGALVASPSGDLTRVSAWQRELATRGALPLRVVELEREEREGSGGGHKDKDKDNKDKDKDKDNDKEIGRVTTHFAPRPLDASLFAIPKSYRNLANR